MDELKRKVEKYETALNHLGAKMRDIKKERDEWQQKATDLEKERDELQQKVTALDENVTSHRKQCMLFKGMFNGVMAIVKEVLMNWPVEKEPIQKKRKCDGNSDEESDEQFKEILRIRAAFEANMEFDAYRPANNQVIKKLGEGATKWKVRFVGHICGPDETSEVGRACFHVIQKMSKEIQSFAPCVEEVALDIVKPRVDEYAEKVLKSRNRLHLTSRIHFGWRLIVVGLSETNGMEVHLVPERNWVGTHVWPDEP